MLANSQKLNQTATTISSALSHLPVSICGECIHIHLHIWAFRGPCEQGDTGSCLCMGWWDVHARSITSEQWRGELREPLPWALLSWDQSVPQMGPHLWGGFLFCKLQLLFPVVHRPAVPRTRIASEKASPCAIHQQLAQRWIDIKYKHHHFLPRIIMDLTASVLMHVSKGRLSTLAWNCLPRRLPQYCLWEMCIWGFTFLRMPLFWHQTHWHRPPRPCRRVWG